MIQAALSYRFSREQIYQMLTSIATSAAETATDLLPKLTGVVGMSPSAVVSSHRPSTSTSTEDFQQHPSETPVVLKTEQLPFVCPLETLFGITVDGLLSSGECDFGDSLGEGDRRSSELAGLVVEEVCHRVNVAMHKNILKISAASSPCFVYFRPDDSCANIGELLISEVIRKLGHLHCHISPRVATTAVGTVLAEIEGELPSAPRTSRTGEATSNLIDYIVEDVIRAWSKDPAAASRTWKSGPVPVLRPTFESHEGGLSLVLLESDQPSGRAGPKTTTLFDSLMTALYMSKCSGHFSGQDISHAASGRLHQRLADLMTCALRCEREAERVSEEARDFLHYFVEELVQRLFVSSTFPQPAKLPENTLVMPFTISEEDFDLTVVDHLTELVASQVFELLAQRFPATEATALEVHSQAVSVQDDLPKLTFRSRIKAMKSNIFKKIKNPFRSSKSAGDAEESTGQGHKKKSSFLGWMISFSRKIQTDSSSS